jgi:hypothetical protein
VPRITRLVRVGRSINGLCLCIYWLPITVTAWYHTKRLMQLRPLSDLLCSPLSSNPSSFILQSSLLWLQQIPSSEGGETWRETSLNFACKYLCSRLTAWGRRLFLPCRGSRAPDSVALKIPWLSAGFEPAILGPNGKHDNHYTTDNDNSLVNQGNAFTDVIISLFLASRRSFSYSFLWSVLIPCCLR